MTDTFFNMPNLTSQRVTIKDIAKIAGVSQATVSYVVNNRQSGFRISKETALRILTVCRQLNYHPDETAIQLYECRKAPLKLLVASPWLYSQFSDFTSQMNIAMKSEEEKSRLNVTYASYESGQLKKCLKKSVLKQYEAVLVVGTREDDDAWLKKHAEELSKVVLMNRRVEGFVSSYGNDREAVLELTQHIDLDYYSRVATVVSPRHSFCEQQRFEGFFQECTTRGKNVKVLMNCGYDDLWNRVLEMLRQDESPLLIFVPQYIPAARLMKSAASAGIDIPRCLGIMGYDRHSLLDEYITPKMTTVDPCLADMTLKSIELLFGKREPQPQEDKVTKAQIILGDSTVNLVTNMTKP